jgi:hypothetical protein
MGLCSFMETTDNIGKRISDHLSGVGEISSKMIKKRAIEIAILNDRPQGEPNENDWQQALEELKSPSMEREANDAQLTTEILNNAADSIETGRKIENQRPEDFVSPTQQLVDEGFEEAEHDTAVQGHKDNSSNQ